MQKRRPQWRQMVFIVVQKDSLQSPSIAV